MNAEPVISLVIAIASFGYAVWQQRSASSVKRLTVRLTSDVRETAQTIASINRGTATEAHAESIIRISQTLTEAAQGRAASAPPFTLSYHPPRLETRIARLVEDDNAYHGHAYRGRLSGEPVREDDAPQRAMLVYGPYEGLPFAGRYRADFRIRAEADPRRSSDSPLLRIEVFALRAGGVIASSMIPVSGVKREWETYSLEFRYSNPGTLLEYRVIVLMPDVDVFFDQVKVELGR